MQRKVNKELEEICRVIVAGLDGKPELHPKRDLFNNDQEVLDDAKWRIKENSGSNIQGFGDHEYEGGYDGKGIYTITGRHHEIKLSEQQARDVVDKKIDRLPIAEFSSDFIIEQQDITKENKEYSK
jgi:hypothetical protein